MRNKEIQKLSDKDFHKLAKEQINLFPDLLKITDEETVIDSFYSYYSRKHRERLSEKT